MQDAEAPALVWAVRREIELLLDVLPDSDEDRSSFHQDLQEVRVWERSLTSFNAAVAHKFMLTKRCGHVCFQNLPLNLCDGSQVAQITGLDGFVHLICKLAEKAASSAGSAQLLLEGAASHIINFCLSHSHLASAVVLGFERAKAAGVQVEEFATSLFGDGNAPVQLALALAESEGDTWRHLGTEKKIMSMMRSKCRTRRCWPIYECKSFCHR
jgi:hypothetical protein